MTLRQKQSKFASLLSMLLAKFEDFGFEVTLGRAYVEGDSGCHGMRLAIDLNVFINGVWQKNGKGHDVVGPWWEKLDKDCRWGGRFVDKKHPGGPDSNHYSLTHNGKG